MSTPSAAPLPAASFDSDTVVQDTVRWLERAVIDLNLCPFAKGVHTKGQIHYVVSPATDGRELLQDLQRDSGISYLLISHDLAVVNHLCDTVAVLYQGRTVEQGPPEELFSRPQHPYTRTLLAAMPRMPGH